MNVLSAMKKSILSLSLAMTFYSCGEAEEAENIRGIPGPADVEVEAPIIVENEEQILEPDFQTLRQRVGNNTYLMQEYYLVLLKKGEGLTKDSTEIDELTQAHLQYWSRVATEDFTELSGMIVGDESLREIVILRVSSERLAQRIASEGPLVQAGILVPKVLPLWLRTEND